MIETFADVRHRRQATAPHKALIRGIGPASHAIGCFDAKYHYLFWRPGHAIPRADTDGNDATDADATWTPLLNVNHPEHPSGAGCVNGAITGTLAAFFGTDEVPFAMSSSVTGTTRNYDRFSSSLGEDLDARVWSGLHFRDSMVDGAVLGLGVADRVADTLFIPT